MRTRDQKIRADLNALSRLQREVRALRIAEAERSSSLSLFDARGNKARTTSNLREGKHPLMSQVLL